MECGMEYGMDYGTHLVYHKHANYVAMPINYSLSIQLKDEMIAVINDSCMCTCIPIAIA